eukprot:gene22802-28966_t
MTLFIIGSGAANTSLSLWRLESGSCPCHLNELPNGSGLFVANYWSGTLSLLPVDADGSLGDLLFTTDHNHNRLGAEGTVAHVHQVVVSPFHKDVVYVCDLGTDTIYTYSLSTVGNNRWLELIGQQMLPTGSGQRHLVINSTGTHAYIVSELKNTVCSVPIDPVSHIIAASGEDSAVFQHSTIDTSIQSNVAFIVVVFAVDVNSGLIYEPSAVLTSTEEHCREPNDFESDKNRPPPICGKKRPPSSQNPAVLKQHEIFTRKNTKPATTSPENNEEYHSNTTKEFFQSSVKPSLYDGRVAVAARVNASTGQSYKSQPTTDGSMWTKQDPVTGEWRQASATTYQSKGQQQYSAAIGANSAYNNRKTDDYYYRDSPSPSTPPRTVPEIAMVMCRLVEAGLGFTQSTVMSVLAKDDCWNAISFIHALRARETGRKCDMLKSMRTSIDAAMDMVIVDLIVTLINVYKFDRDDVLDAIATFRCHNVEDALNLMEQAQLNREGNANASSSASASCVLSTSSTPHGSSIQQHEDSMNPTSTSSTSQLSAAAQEDDTDPALLPYDPALGSYSDYLKARADALKRRDGDKNMIDEGSDAKF